MYLSRPRNLLWPQAPTTPIPQRRGSVQHQTEIPLPLVLLSLQPTQHSEQFHEWCPGRSDAASSYLPISSSQVRQTSVPRLAQTTPHTGQSRPSLLPLLLGARSSLAPRLDTVPLHTQSERNR